MNNPYKRIYDYFGRDTQIDKLREEVEELKEDIQAVRKLQFGAEIYEAFESMFSKKFISESGLEEELSEKEQRLTAMEEKLTETSKQLEVMRREKKMSEVLESLHGNAREVMETVLRNIPTDKLEEAYAHYIPKVLHESAVSTSVESEKESDNDSSVLAEGETGDNTVVTEGTVVVDGNGEAVIEESAAEEELPQHVKVALARLQALSGIQK
jgi:hypothetical protein